MNMVKKPIEIKFEVTSYEGHSEYKMLPKQALAYMKQQQEKESKWLFLGTEHKNANLISEKDLVKATSEGKNISMMNALAGGYMVCSPISDDVGKPEVVIRTELKIVKKQKSSIVIDLEETENGFNITANVKSDQLFPIVANRDTIRRAIQHMLNQKAEQEYESVTDVAQEKYDKLDEKYSAIDDEISDYKSMLKL